MTVDAPSYFDAYESFRLERHDGVLTITLHSNGGPFVFNEQAHHDFAEVFGRVALDDDNRVVILTGTGDRFCADFDFGSFYEIYRADRYRGWLRVQSDGERMLTAFLDIPVPTIAVVNGPAASHAELPVLADIVLAAGDAFFQDATHFVVGAVPGDGAHTVWTSLLGLNRGRHFLLTGQRLSAADAHAAGVVAEVLPRADLLPRAQELANSWARRPQTVLVGTRRVLTMQWRRLLHEQLFAGLAAEGLAATARPLQPPEPAIRDLLA